jgi:cytochrome c
MNKNLIYIAAFLFFGLSCSDTKKESEEPEAPKAPETETKAPPPVATLKNGISQEDHDKGLALVAKSDCLSCHKLLDKFTGPAYRDVANRYTAHPDTIDKLATKIIKGGVGNWGPIPMTPHPTLSKEDAVQMVKYVLTIE